MLSKEQVVRWLEGYAAVIEAQRQYLTDLDAAIGDADHGTNLDRGFRKVLSQLPSLADKDIGSILKGVGMALISSVGGASGPLYGTFFMRAGMALDKKESAAAAEVGAMLQAGLDGIIQRGKAQPGDKTMVDALTPAIAAFQGALDDGGDVAAALRAAAEGARQGVEATIPMVARKGRASYLGERSAGHPDPGATSSAMLLEALAEAAMS